MKVFGRRKRPAGIRTASGEDRAHLEGFARSRTGVEAYVEPSTTFSATTVVLVAADGEWTRRRAGGPAEAAQLGQRLGIPVYDATVVGYPRRMREWTSRQKAGGTGAGS